MRRRLGAPCWAVLALAGPPAPAGVPQSDGQLWGEADVTAPLVATASATALGVVRDGEGLPDPALAGGGLTLDATSGSWTFTAGNLWVAARNAASGKTLDIDVPLAAISYGWTFAGALFSDRNRVEWFEGIPQVPWRYRNRLMMEYPVSGAGPIGSLFASDEIFYDGQRGKWTRNRAQFGFGLPIAPGQQCQIYFLRQDDRYARPGALNVLGFAYKVDFR